MSERVMPCCGRTEDRPHTAECPSAIAQDRADGGTDLPRVCGECGGDHPAGQDCGPDPDGSYPCSEGHYGCARTLRGEHGSQAATLRDADDASTEELEAAAALYDDTAEVDEDGEPVPPFWSAALYEVDRHYGGPEEGGWWYDAGEPSERPAHAVLSRVFATAEEAYAYAQAALAPIVEVANRGRRPISSVLSSGEVQYRVARGFPAAFPKHRPHYE